MTLVITSAFERTPVRNDLPGVTMKKTKLRFKKKYFFLKKAGGSSSFINFFSTFFYLLRRFDR